MLYVQKYLQTHGLDKLKSEYAIKTVEHEDGRVILNYDQIESPKLEDITRECRGLVLDKSDWSLVARSFSRFFNLGEHIPEQKKFIWEGSIATDKEDGSLILLYHWDGWKINTRGSFADGVVGGSDISWSNYVDWTLGWYDPNWKNSLPKQYTYVFEFCSRLNKVVRDYDKPRLYLLTMFSGEMEINHETVNHLAEVYNLDTPNTYVFDDVYSVTAHIAKVADNDKTYEGVVLRDKNNRRLKAKSPEYVALHHMAANGAIASPKRIIPFILKGETEEVLAYFPELCDYVKEMETVINDTWKELDNLWFCYHDEKNRKKFANAVKHHPFSGILFAARDRGCDPKEIWLESAELIVKRLFK